MTNSPEYQRKYMREWRRKNLMKYRKYQREYHTVYRKS